MGLAVIAPSQVQTALRVLRVIDASPGHTGVGLQKYGMRPADGQMIGTLEHEGLIEYDGGWFVTPDGTKWLYVNG